MNIARLALAAALACGAGGQPRPLEWQPLFDGRSLQGWRQSGFARQPAAIVENGAIILPHGEPLTGITRTEPIPAARYEVRFEAMRVKGGDFFASLTFPVRGTYCTWVTGGWGGDIVGISSIDGWDASDNETRSYYNFDSNRWYGFRLRVSEERITAWIDDRPVVNLKIGDRGLSLRPGEIKLSVPLGFASYNTTGALRKIEYRELKDAAGQPPPASR